MSSLVEELQRDALDSSIPVADLLRKALVVATKLKLDEFREWVELELNGYRVVDVPYYRKAIGQAILHNPRRGAMPMVFGDPKMAEVVSQHEHRAPVGPLEELAGSSGSRLAVDFPPELQNLLLAPFPYQPGIPQLEISRSSVVMILDAVRNAILKWSLTLEAEGIVGEGMSFSPIEREKAQQHRTELRPVNFIQIGTMENSVIQQSSPDARGSALDT
jgi:hypothetical protein